MNDERINRLGGYGTNTWPPRRGFKTVSVALASACNR